MRKAMAITEDTVMVGKRSWRATPASTPKKAPGLIWSAIA
jgi:hypothetical protein